MTSEELEALVPPPPRWWQIGPRGVILLAFATLFITHGFGHFNEVRAQLLRKAIPLAYTYVSPHTWGYIWIATGLCAAVSAFVRSWRGRHNALGFYPIVGMFGCWTGFFSVAALGRLIGVDGGTASAWAGVVTWGCFFAISMACRYAADRHRL